MKHQSRTGGITFYLGTHQPGWLSRVHVPLFISHRRLACYQTLPIARHAWALDSGAFSELSQYGCWRFDPEVYVVAVRRYRDQIGQLAWAAPQDWMCEPFMVAKTGLSITEHQHRTVHNYLTLRRLAPDLPFIPVLQGWTTKDYLRCVVMYRAAGIDLTKQSLVGLGSVCRRQATDEIATIVTTLTGLGLHLHGFGVKATGLRRYGRYLASADSLAWSFRGRYIAGCAHPALNQSRRARSEANCLTFALEWRKRLLDACRTDQFEATPRVAA
ncbi:MAG: hypothetical protein LC808_37070 [Actinobacteria bacterium]|nr:hypothetical protein [Actinomycetota bacterium]